MTQANVERVIGQLVTDEAFRRRFARDSRAALEELVPGGILLSHLEVEALLAINLRMLAFCAKGIDPRLLKCDLRGSTGEVE